MYTFKKQIFGFMDLLRFKKMVPKRRKIMAEGSAQPLPKTYRVNETAKILHPGYQHAKLVAVRDLPGEMRTLCFETEEPLYFRAGQYVTLGCKVGGSDVSRPYAISSAPRDGLSKKIEIAVKKCGFFSGYLCDEAKAGDTFLIGDPSGEFFHEPLRDAPLVVACAGGSGITPFLSMAKAIADGTEDFRLLILCGDRTEKDIAFGEELRALAGDKIRVVHVLSDEVREGYEHGFITAELIEKYTAGEEYTLMMCGPSAMYKFLDGEIAKLGLPLRRVRREANCVGTRDVPAAKHTLTVHIGFEVFTVQADARETVLVAMERAGLQVPSKCRAGGCGFCHSRILSGSFTIAGADKRRLADEKFGYFHPCCSYPDSDMEIVVPKRKV